MRVDSRHPRRGFAVPACFVPSGRVEPNLLWLFARYDLEQAIATHVRNFMGEETRTDYRLGGFMAGLTFEVGMRLESPHPWNQGGG